MCLHSDHPNTLLPPTPTCVPITGHKLMQLTGVLCCDCRVDGSRELRASLIKRHPYFHALIFTVCVYVCGRATGEFIEGRAGSQSTASDHPPTTTTTLPANKHCLHTSQIKRSVSLQLLEADGGKCTRTRINLRAPVSTLPSREATA